MKHNIYLEDSLIRLMPIEPERDNEAFFKMFLESEMHLYTGNKIPHNPEETYQLLLNYVQMDGIMAWSIYHRSTDEFVGIYWIAEPTEMEGEKVVTAEAQRISKKFWRKGYTKVARKLIYTYAFDTLQAKAIYAQAWEENQNSCCSMENFGFKCYKEESVYSKKHNKMMIEKHYVLKR